MLPVSALIDEDIHGISDVCLSLPTVVDAAGAGQRLPIAMSADELAGLRASAQTLREMQARFGL